MASVKVTISIPEALLENARVIAQRQGTTVSALAARGLRQAIRRDAMEASVRNARLYADDELAEHNARREAILAERLAKIEAHAGGDAATPAAADATTPPADAA